MWFLLLVAIEGGVHRAEVIVPTLEQCLELRTQEDDVCIRVDVSLPELPERGPTG
jgi:hypothetical protein